MDRVSSPTFESGTRSATGVSGSARASLKGSHENHPMDNESTKGATPSRVSLLGDEGMEGSIPMDNMFCNVAQGAIARDKMGVSPLSSGRLVAINSMVEPFDKRRGGAKSVTSSAKGVTNALQMSQIAKRNPMKVWKSMKKSCVIVRL
ncbi:hypothetical protein U1Q18_048009 [Sarracenia purpurea var. burkii]